MHTVDLSLEEITKVEGAATLELKVRDGKVEKCEFAIAESKRFYTQAIRGKPYISVPQLLARICGTCSNAHLLASIESCENALGITPTEQSLRLKRLTMDGLIIRDHALHLYLFALPDQYGKDAFLEFDESIDEEHQILHDAFDIKAAGNELSTLVAGRSVHGLLPRIGGFQDVPTPEGIAKIRRKLEDTRPAVRRTIDRFLAAPFSFDRKTHFMALVADPFGYLHGEIVSDDGMRIAEKDYRTHLEHTVIPYSQASGYTYKGKSYMVGALARINLSKATLHPNTKRDAADALAKFPSTNIYHNNLAQAIELLNSYDQALDALSQPFTKEELVKPTRQSGVGIGVIEAPRGTLYHKIDLGADGKVREAEIIVPTGQNQINIEQDLAGRVEELLPSDPSKETLQLELERLIRAYDPCMSCASHFLTLNVDGMRR